jgi:ribosomal protein S18 acetylase RimI-like enzyme
MLVEPLEDVSEETVRTFRRLLSQLSPSAESPTRETLQRVVGAHGVVLLVAREQNGIVGTLTLATYEAPTGRRAWIEDVVVDEQARGRGVGEALTREALRIAKERGARTVDLTSRPSREAANRLYQRLGFVRRETNVYRLTF